MDRRNQIPAEFIWLLHPLRRLKIYQHILFPSYEETATNWTTPGMFLKSQAKLKSRHTSGNWKVHMSRASNWKRRKKPKILKGQKVKTFIQVFRAQSGIMAKSGALWARDLGFNPDSTPLLVLSSHFLLTISLSHFLCLPSLGIPILQAAESNLVIPTPLVIPN